MLLWDSVHYVPVWRLVPIIYNSTVLKFIPRMRLQPIYELSLRGAQIILTRTWKVFQDAPAVYFYTILTRERSQKMKLFFKISSLELLDLTKYARLFFICSSVREKQPCQRSIWCFADFLYYQLIAYITLYYKYQRCRIRGY